MRGQSLKILVGILILLLISVTESARPLTDKESEAVAQLLPLVKDVLDEPYMSSESYLVKYLIATKFDIRRAEQKLRDVHQWRRDNNVNTILNEKDLDKGTIFLPQTYNVLDIVDREGDPIFLMHFGEWDMRKAGVTGRTEQVHRHWIQMMETIQKRIRDMDEGKAVVRRFTVIADLQGYNARSHTCARCLSLHLRITRTFQTYYPEAWKRIFVVNAPAIFIPVLNILQEIVKNGDGLGIESYSTNKRIWEPIILKQIPPDQIPPRYGGTRKL